MAQSLEPFYSERAMEPPGRMDLVSEPQMHGVAMGGNCQETARPHRQCHQELLELFHEEANRAASEPILWSSQLRKAQTI